MKKVPLALWNTCGVSVCHSASLNLLLHGVGTLKTRTTASCLETNPLKEKNQKKMLCKDGKQKIHAMVTGSYNKVFLHKPPCSNYLTTPQVPFPPLSSWNAGMKNEVCSVNPLQASPWSINRQYWIEVWNLVLNQAFAWSPALQGAELELTLFHRKKKSSNSFRVFSGGFQGLWFSLRCSAIHGACSTVPLRRTPGEDRCARLHPKKSSSVSWGLEGAWGRVPGLEVAVVGTAQSAKCPTTILLAVAHWHQNYMCAALQTHKAFFAVSIGFNKKTPGTFRERLLQTVSCVKMRVEQTQPRLILGKRLNQKLWSWTLCSSLLPPGWSDLSSLYQRAAFFLLRLAWKMLFSMSNYPMCFPSHKEPCSSHSRQLICVDLHFLDIQISSALFLFFSSHHPFQFYFFSSSLHPQWDSD